MAKLAAVKCQYCSQNLDRNKEPFVTIPHGKTNRYAHAACYKIEKEKNPELPEYEIADLTGIVKCRYCKQEFDTKKVPYVMVGERFYAHKKCAIEEANRKKTDEDKLDDYLMKIYNVDYVPPRIKRQIQNFKEEYNFTASGMLKSLIYFYEVKGNPIDQSNQTIGIVPYVYQDAFNYYYSIWLAQQRNETKIIEEYKPEVFEVSIPRPQREKKKSKLFAFLDEEEEK